LLKDYFAAASSRRRRLRRSPQIPGIVEGKTRSISGAPGQADPALPGAGL